MAFMHDLCALVQLHSDANKKVFFRLQGMLDQGVAVWCSADVALTSRPDGTILALPAVCRAAVTPHITLQTVNRVCSLFWGCCRARRHMRCMAWPALLAAAALLCLDRLLIGLSHCWVQHVK